jgi:pimeloyl-ACP methyl ester carboxylesterase
VLELGGVDVGSVHLAYRSIGAPDAAPMVLLHGLGLDGSNWETIAAGFAASHRVFAPDLRGHGASDWPGAYSVELMRDDVLGFLDALGLGPVTLIGHSLGGSVAMLFAEDYPDRIARLVLEDAPPPFAVGDPVPIRPRPDGPLPFDWRAVEAIVGQLNDPDPAWWDKAGSILIPTFVVSGGPQSPTSPEQVAQIVARIPHCALATIPVGHHVHRELPVEFIAAVRDFLRGEAD